MQGTQYRNILRNCLTLVSVSIALSGCLMGEEKAKSNQEISADIAISGSVGDGPVVSASMMVMRNDGELLAEFLSDASANYSIMVNTMGRYYPLTISASEGTDLVTGQTPDFDMSGAVFGADSSAVANINPFSTIAIEIARALPDGITADNLQLAEAYVIRELSSGLTSLTVSSPMRDRIDAANISEIVKASETLSETIRRTRDLQRTFNRISTGDVVVRQIAADLVDGIVDGLGAAGTDARVSAIQSVVSVQVFLESIQNELHVNGQDATAAMTAAVDQVSDSTPTETIEQQRATREMISVINIGLDAIMSVDPNPALVTLKEAMSGVQPGMEASLIKTLIPSNYRMTLAAAILNIAGGSDAAIDNINDVIRAGSDDEPSVNRAPTISGTPGSSIMVGVSYSFTPTADDLDGDVLTFAITGRPGWATFNTSTGTLTGTPDTGDVGNFDNIGITVMDGNASASLPEFSITVSMTNSAPTIAGTPPTQVLVGANYNFLPTANDPDGDTLSFTSSGLPAWASFDVTNGRISGTPAAADAGTYANIGITVSDGTDSASLGPFSINVIGNNSPPSISGTPPSQVNTGENYGFTPTASDPDGDTLIFSVSSLPDWAAFNSASGEISGTPGRQDAGTYNNIGITVSDGSTIATLPSFSITVVLVNAAPTISGTPASSVNVNNAYSFTPTANDPDGDALTFSVTGLPSWANFNTSTGALTGTPGSADVGVYSNIAISVSDGLENASLQAFSITVQDVSLGSVTLNWTAPTQNEDGTPLTDLAGYRFYWGTTPGTYTDSVTVNNPGLTTYVVDNLPSGSYEFVATSFNTSGVESVYSNTSTKVVP